MKFSESLKKNFQFRAVYRKGISLADRNLVIYLLKNGNDINRIGISVSKKVGNSVVRSRVTRLIRESYRLNEEFVKCGYDIVVIARVSSKDKDYNNISRSLINLLKRHHIYSKPKK